jgi:hypothetical protein
LTTAENPVIVMWRSFASFLWPQVWKEKKSSETKSRIQHILPNKGATFLVKYKRGIYGLIYFTNMAAPLLCKKTVPTIGRVCLFAARD